MLRSSTIDVRPETRAAEVRREEEGGASVESGSSCGEGAGEGGEVALDIFPRRGIMA